MRSAAWRPLGGVVGVVAGAGEEFFEGVEAPVPLSPARSPCPPHPATKLPHGGGGPPREVGGGVGGGGGSELGVRERQWRGPGAADTCRWCGERETRGRGCRSCREGDADMGWRWRAWWRSGEHEWRERALGELWRRLGERERCEWGLGVGEARLRRGDRERRGRERRSEGEGEWRRFQERASSRGEPGHFGGNGGARVGGGGGKLSAPCGSAS